jgi:hypothetical protein
MFRRFLVRARAGVESARESIGVGAVVKASTDATVCVPIHTPVHPIRTQGTSIISSHEVLTFKAPGTIGVGAVVKASTDATASASQFERVFTASQFERVFTAGPGSQSMSVL